MSEPYIQYIVYESSGDERIRISNNLSDYLPVDADGFMTLPTPLRIFTCSAVNTTDSTYTANASDRFNSNTEPYILDGTMITPFGYVKGVYQPVYSTSKCFGRTQLNVLYYITAVKNEDFEIFADEKPDYDQLNFLWPDRWYPVAVTDVLKQPYHLISDYALNGNGGLYLSRPRVQSFNDIAWSWINPVPASSGKFYVGVSPMHIG